RTPLAPPCGRGRGGRERRPRRARRQARAPLQPGDEARRLPRPRGGPLQRRGDPARAHALAAGQPPVGRVRPGGHVPHELHGHAGAGVGPGPHVRGLAGARGPPGHPHRRSRPGVARVPPGPRHPLRRGSSGRHAGVLRHRGQPHRVAALLERVACSRPGPRVIASLVSGPKNATSAKSAKVAKFSFVASFALVALVAFFGPLTRGKNQTPRARHRPKAPPVRTPGEEAMASRRRTRSAVSGCVRKRDAKPPTRKGFTTKRCEAAGLLTPSGTCCAAASIFCRARARGRGSPTRRAPEASAWNSRLRLMASWMSMAATGARIATTSAPRRLPRRPPPP